MIRDLLTSVVCLCILTGCATKTAVSQSQPSLPQAYLEAVADAKVPDASKVSRDLIPLINNPDLVYDDAGRVLVSTWSKSAYFSGLNPGDATTLGGSLNWFTPAPEAQEFCTAFDGEDLNLRLAQWLGMPPNQDKDGFAEFFVHPRHLFRPCPDPEVYDSQCVPHIPLEGDPPAQDGGPPWYCDPRPVLQVGALWQTVSQAHLNWMCQNWKDSYETTTPYPWTALGYTYDWGNPDSRFGGSEYVGFKGAPAVFHRFVRTNDYCGRGED